MMDWESCLMQGGRYGLALLALDLAALEFELHEILLRDLEDRMGVYLVH